MKNYHLQTGVILSIFIAALTSVPRIIRIDLDNYDHVVWSFFYNFVYCLFCWVILQFCIQRGSIQNSLFRGFLGLLVCIGYSVLYHFLSELYFPSYVVIPILKGLNFYQRLFMIMFRGAVVGGFIYFVVYYLNLLLETQKARIENEQLKQENLQARLHSLRQQISPHFLFNSLNTLKTIASENTVKEYILQLSYVYRYLLNYNENNLATIQDELSFLQSYSYILKERFEDALQLEITISDQIKEKCIPPLSLQILLENAIKHNIVSLSRPLQIRIYNEGEDSLVVENNLQSKLSVEESTGIGLQNISDRYKLLANQSIEIIRAPNQFSIKIPVLSC
ncbi:histidine kinase [Cytophagaceae bacterium DM2B3-1]|uniref:Histidine kinase n=1 Tax=Xanthocytophaga flava TaxID=3048013 RepID=A0ABT7CP92_9BACT|nr:histidine kinase [Xanthocytophaga flavus]MDJ1495522.1 histidine kinase [Xanthocytophaga flavus]